MPVHEFSTADPAAAAAPNNVAQLLWPLYFNHDQPVIAYYS